MTDYARGGIIPPGTGPVLARGCEFYLTAQQARALGTDALDRLNTDPDDTEGDS